MRTIVVELGERSYPIHIGRAILTSLPEICSSLRLPPPLAVVTDKNVAALHLKQLTKILRRARIQFSPLVMPAGERQKSLSRAHAITTRLLEDRHPRSSPIVAFGGGVIGDVAGFVAANYRRGTPLVQIPTTLLGQVESSIGGKVGVNHPLAKNAIGTFHQPKFVLSDVGLLSTLPRREIICGMGEMMKYAILDEGICSTIEQHLDSIMRLDLEILEEVIFRCNTLKARMISEDERETSAAGGRMVLNLGHRIGHALEQMSNFTLHHGEAVMIGLRWELAIALQAQLVDRGSYDRINRLLERIDFRPKLNFVRMELLIASIFGKDRKARFVFPAAIGKITASDSLGAGFVRSALRRAVSLR